jgi:integrase
MVEGDFAVATTLPRKQGMAWEPKAGWIRTRAPDKWIEGLTPPANGAMDYRDKVVPGLRLRVLHTGVKTFVLLCRPPTAKGHVTRRALGRWGELTLDEARDKARAWLALIGKGIDPTIVAAAERAANQLKSSETFGAVADDFLERYAPGIAKAQECRNIVQREFISRWKDRPFGSITGHEAREAIQAIAKRGIYQAHNAFGYLRRLYSWAQGSGYTVLRSPLDGLSANDIIGAARKPRERVLTDDEVRCVWTALGGMGFPWTPLFKLLILTAQRETEISEMRWSEIDFDKRLWTIPANRMKGARSHEVPLAPQALAILKALPRYAGDFVFSVNGGKSPVNSFGKSKARLDKACGVTGWKIHDLRRTARTHFSALPVQDLVRELVIAHAKPGLHKVYDQHAYASEKTECLRLWEHRLAGILAPKLPAEVVPIAKAKARRK